MCPGCSAKDVLGVEVPGVYDGVLYWVCDACGVAWARDWTGFGSRQAVADAMVTTYNLTRGGVS